MLALVRRGKSELRALVAWLLGALASRWWSGEAGPAERLAAIHASRRPLLWRPPPIVGGPAAWHRAGGRMAWHIDFAVVIAVIVAINGHAVYVRRPADTAPGWRTRPRRRSRRARSAA